MTTLYMAGMSSQALPVLAEWPWADRELAFLASFAYPEQMERVLGLPTSRRMLDSGAFTAYTLDKAVDLDALAAEAATGRWETVVALDVIGDPEGSVRNALRMRDEYGLDVMPVHHIGDPWEHLVEYARGFSRVGLSCRFGESIAESLRYYDQAFARGWPARFHSFGWIGETALRRFPFATADAASAFVAPTAWRFFAREERGRMTWGRIPVDGDQATNGIRHALEVLWRLQVQLQRFWAPTLAQIGDET